ncbi:unnamed protein product [Haemonchus placei]|uniref:Uncharacterized protein n=1 Tax=Haemonchus placei TaxID=6290 RepID=A0A0N4WB27_HAEPC|nr:unnamed protein product [Haemonchus placei]
MGLTRGQSANEFHYKADRGATFAAATNMKRKSEGLMCGDSRGWGVTNMGDNSPCFQAYIPSHQLNRTGSQCICCSIHMDAGDSHEDEDETADLTGNAMGTYRTDVRAKTSPIMHTLHSLGVTSAPAKGTTGWCGNHRIDRRTISRPRSIGGVHERIAQM